MKNCRQKDSCIKPHYDWSDVGASEPMSGLEWAAIIAMILSVFFAGTTAYLMIKLYDATGRYF